MTKLNFFFKARVIYIILIGDWLSCHLGFVSARALCWPQFRNSFTIRPPHLQYMGKGDAFISDVFFTSHDI